MREQTQNNMNQVSQTISATKLLLIYLIKHRGDGVFLKTSSS